MNNSFKDCSEKDVKLMLAPLALAIMSNTPDVSGKMSMSSASFCMDQLVEQYESILDSLYNSHRMLNA